MAFQPGEEIAQVLDIPDYQAAPFLVLATRQGRIKKTRLDEYDSNRAGGVIAINLVEGDELVSARLLGDGADILLVSRKGMSLRFTAALRTAGRAVWKNAESPKRATARPGWPALPSPSATPTAEPMAYLASSRPATGLPK